MKPEKKEMLVLWGLIILVCVSPVAIGFALGFSVGRASNYPQVDTTYVSRISSVDRPLTEWEVFELATVKTESEFDTLARGKKNDLGIFQGTEIWVEEVNRIIGEPTYLHADCFDVSKSIEMFNIMQDYYNPGHDISLAIQKHNPRGDAIGYSVRIRKNIEWVKTYERVRAGLTNYTKEHNKDK